MGLVYGKFILCDLTFDSGCVLIKIFSSRLIKYWDDKIDY